MAHRLTKVELDSKNRCYTALCTCRKWAGMAPTVRELRKEHKEHKKFVK